MWNRSAFFFFSSRRRHTRWPRDWSSDVCSSDLTSKRGRTTTALAPMSCWARYIGIAERAPYLRSEERRVGKEGGAREGTGGCENEREAERGGAAERGEQPGGRRADGGSAAGRGT